ncbi:glucoamylase family protein [soil metagenome]
MDRTPRYVIAPRRTPSPETGLPRSNPQGSDGQMLGALQRSTFEYFRREVNPANGLIRDKTQPGSPASIAALGLALTAYPVAVERNFLSRAEAASRTLTLLRFLDSSEQGPHADATGYMGFFYHFLDMETGRRAWECELSTIDTAILMAGVLTVSCYFAEMNDGEREIRDLAEGLYRRVDWQWARNGGTTLTHGWKPESGFLPYRWDCGYSEAHILYVLALGSPTHPIEPQGYTEWTSTFEFRTCLGVEHIYAGPLFIHQMSQIWLDLRGIHDDLNRSVGIDYFENSHRATCMQRQYGIENPLGFAHYHQYGWGLTASDGPGDVMMDVGGVERQFYDYVARGAPDGPDDGTISPWAVVSSLPFAPEIVIDTVRHAIERLDLARRTPYGFDASFNATFPLARRGRHGWVSPWIFGLNQGPIVLMIENHVSGQVWQCAKACPYIVDGLRRAGFRDGWLDLHTHAG